MTLAGSQGRRARAEARRPSMRAVCVAGLVLLLSACGPGEDSVFTLAPGECFDDPEVSEDIRAIPRVPCAQPHDNEVFATFDLAADSYPGGDALAAEALEGCTERFPEQVTAADGDTELAIGALTPTADGWQDGDREVVCIVSSPDGPLTGTLLDAQD